MKQVFQSLANGETMLEEIPCPVVKPGHLLVRTSASVISSGTERMMLDFGRSNWLQRAKRHPDKVRLVLDKVRTDGLGPTIAAVRRKLDDAIPLGYCNAGVVLEIGEGVRGFRPGQRVVSTGSHAQAVCVPQNLAVPIPDGVDDVSAAFAVLGAISLQGMRLAKPELGETFAVFGLGLLGQLAVQLLRASGCRVLGFDPNPERCLLAREFGAETSCEPVSAANAITDGRGVDGVLLTLATASAEPVKQAVEICRPRGRVVLVGVANLELERRPLYDKEVSFQVSCSYGPGRYDPSYERDGNDYPFGLVRFTAQRNIEAVLQAMAAGSVLPQKLISHRVPFDRAAEAYGLLDDPYALGILLEYPSVEAVPDRAVVQRVIERAAPVGPTSGSPRFALIGAGSFGAGILAPAMKAAGAQLRCVVSESGAGASRAANRHGFERLASDPDEALADPQVDAVVIATRHDSHAELAIRALRAGKHVFVEKPLALSLAEVARVEEAWEASGRILMVGFNRRFAPLGSQLKSLLEQTQAPKAFVMTVNAGAIPCSHWTQDAKLGGGRIVGEACHFIDLLRYLAGSPVADIRTSLMKGETGDTATITLAFRDGSIGAIHYFANGHRSLPKERLEVFCSGRVLRLDNWQRLELFGWPGFRGKKVRRQDKGHDACMAAFVEAVRKGEASPIDSEELFEVSRLAIQASANG